MYEWKFPHQVIIRYFTTASEWTGESWKEPSRRSRASSRGEEKGYSTMTEQLLIGVGTYLKGYSTMRQQSATAGWCGYLPEGVNIITEQLLSCVGTYLKGYNTKTEQLLANVGTYPKVFSNRTEQSLAGVSTCLKGYSTMTEELQAGVGTYLKGYSTMRVITHVIMKQTNRDVHKVSFFTYLAILAAYKSKH